MSKILEYSYNISLRRRLQSKATEENLNFQGLFPHEVQRDI